RRSATTPRTIASPSSPTPTGCSAPATGCRSCRWSRSCAPARPGAGRSPPAMVPIPALLVTRRSPASSSPPAGSSGCVPARSRELARRGERLVDLVAELDQGRAHRCVHRLLLGGAEVLAPAAGAGLAGEAAAPALGLRQLLEAMSFSHLVDSLGVDADHRADPLQAGLGLAAQ